MLSEELDKIGEFSGIFKTKGKEHDKKVWISAFKVEDELQNTICYVEIKRNISEFLKLLEHTRMEKERLENKIMIDFLTGVYNRNGFLSKLDERTGGSIVFVDIDRFKNINDTFGHAIGDEIIKSVAQLISSSLRSTDIICRWGGEEFLIWLDADVTNASKICESLRKNIESAKPNGIYVTCSFGIAEYSLDLDDVISKADAAMYAVKQHGRNGVKVFKNCSQNH